MFECFQETIEKELEEKVNSVISRKATARFSCLFGHVIEPQLKRARVCVQSRRNRRCSGESSSGPQASVVGGCSGGIRRQRNVVPPRAVVIAAAEAVSEARARKDSSTVALSHSVCGRQKKIKVAVLTPTAHGLQLELREQTPEPSPLEPSSW